MAKQSRPGRVTAGFELCPGSGVLRCGALALLVAVLTQGMPALAAESDAGDARPALVADPARGVLLDPPSEAETALTQRAAARWQALLDMDWAAAYAYEPPAYRQAFDLVDYRGRYAGQVRWLEAKVQQVEVDPEGMTARVRIRLRYQAAMVGKGTTHLNERWLRQDGQWWYLHK